MDEALTREVWRRLLRGEPLAPLGLPTKNGRLDLRGIAAPEVVVVREFATPVADVRELGNQLVFRNARLENLDLTNSRLVGLRFFHSIIENCTFDGACCQDWRMWGTTVSSSSFHRADLRGSGLGGLDQGRRNIFHDVDFTKTDLRGSTHGCAAFSGCRFVDAKLKKVDFDGSAFEECSFVGILDEVIFNRTGLAGSQVPPNEMKDVDFRNAKLRWCAFRDLDLTSVRWPSDDEHAIVHGIKDVLDRYLSSLKERDDVVARQLKAVLGGQRDHLGANQTVGVVNKLELLEMGGEEAVAEFLRFVGAPN